MANINALIRQLTKQRDLHSILYLSTMPLEIIPIEMISQRRECVQTRKLSDLLLRLILHFHTYTHTQPAAANNIIINK